MPLSFRSQTMGDKNLLHGTEVVVISSEAETGELSWKLC